MEKSWGAGRWMGECLRTLVLNRVELSLYNKGHLYMCNNKKPEAYSEHSQASKKELLQKRLSAKGSRRS